jgi:hypothetical protein
MYTLKICIKCEDKKAEISRIFKTFLQFWIGKDENTHALL